MERQYNTYISGVSEVRSTQETGVQWRRLVGEVLRVAVPEGTRGQHCDRAQRQRLFYSCTLNIYIIHVLFILGFDAQFILRWIHKQAQAPSIIMRGMEILQLEYCGVKLLDSLNFLPMGLAAFPKALGFDAAKGYFPHLFNKKENWNVVLQGLPDKWLV